LNVVEPPGVALSRPTSLGELGERHRGAVDADAREFVVRRVSALENAIDGDLCPLTSSRHLADALGLLDARDVALLVDAELAPRVPAGRRWVHEHASWALAAVLCGVEPEKANAVSQGAVVEKGAEVGAGVSIGNGALVMAGACVGERSIVEPHAVVYPRVRIGARVVIGAGAVIGRPGFGWASGPGGALVRIPQLGGVWIEDDVEVGPLATVDAGTLGPTILRRGVRLDAHVHVGHNAVIGQGTIVAAQSGFAGSVRIGEGVRIGGQAGVSDHAKIGDRARIAAKAGVIGDIPVGAVVAGYPAVTRARWLRGVARMLAAGGGPKAAPSHTTRRKGTR
jgi:UDP-3-O-[3-hydroxymyristoyl] glucosamine N-acyltransferase